MSPSAPHSDTESGGLLAASYERLRGDVLDQGIRLDADLGLGVLMNRAMGAWMQLRSHARVVPLPPREAAPRSLVFDAARSEIVGVLVGMALGSGAWGRSHEQ
jgi:hypothetical protein